MPDPTPDEPLPELPKPAQPTRRTQLAVVLFALVVGAGLWFATRERPPPPEHVLFADRLPDWVVSRSKGHGGAATRAMLLGAAKQWPGVHDALAVLDDSWDDRQALHAAIAPLNAAIRAAGLGFWVDDPVANGVQFLTTSTLEGRVRFTLEDGRRTEVLRVRRLDHLNLRLQFLGHAGGDQPVVLLDRLEPETLESLRNSYAGVDGVLPEGDEKQGEVERAARRLWRETREASVGAEPMREAARAVAARDSALKELERGVKGALRIEPPDRLAFGDAFFDDLEPYTDMGRRGGPLLLGRDLRALAAADRVLRDGPARVALEALLDLDATDTEIHEARHVFEPVKDDDPVPPSLLEIVGDDDLRFARSSSAELRAYLSELAESPHPKAFLATLALRAAGDRARSTPHHYAALTILRALSDTPDATIDRAFILRVLEALPKEGDAALRARAERAYDRIVMERRKPSTRAVQPMDATR